MDVVSIGRRLRFARLLRELTCCAVGELIGVNKATVSRYECGFVARPSIPTISMLCDALKVNMAWVMGVPGALATDDTEELRWLGMMESVETWPYRLGYRFPLP